MREGDVGPFESIKLEIVFTPTIPGKSKLDFYIKFSNVTSKPVRHSLWMNVMDIYNIKLIVLKVDWTHLFKQIPITVRGVAVSLPVWVVQPSIDLKICMFDRLYQDSIMVQSRWVQEVEWYLCAVLCWTKTHSLICKSGTCCKVKVKQGHGYYMTT